MKNTQRRGREEQKCAEKLGSRAYSQKGELLRKEGTAKKKTRPEKRREKKKRKSLSIEGISAKK